MLKSLIKVLVRLAEAQETSNKQNKEWIQYNKDRDMKLEKRDEEFMKKRERNEQNMFQTLERNNIHIKQYIDQRFDELGEK